jgi:hypothetical protein
MKTTYPLRTLKPEFVKTALVMSGIYIDDLTTVATIQDVFAKLHEKGMDFSLDDAIEIKHKNHTEEKKTSEHEAKLNELKSTYRVLSECYVPGSTNKVNKLISEQMDKILTEIKTVINNEKQVKINRD